MKQTIAANGNIISRQVAEHPWLARAGALGMVVTLVACSSSNGASTSESSPPPAATGAASSSPRPTLPAGWPAPEKLGSKDCSWGTPIDHQKARLIGGVAAAMVDSRCEPPFDQPYAGVYPGPSYVGPAVGSVNNGEWVTLNCKGKGVPVGDSRGAEQNSEWFGITFNATDGQIHEGRLNGANMGQLDARQAAPQLPECP